MLNQLYANLETGAPAARTIIAIALMLLAGYLLSRVTTKLHLPNVTAYILAGILLGPFCLNLVPADIVEGTGFLPDIALAFIAFSTGEFFRLSTLKKNGMRVILITLLESLLATLFVFLLCDRVLHLELAFSAVLSALAAATAPASTLMTIRQTGAKGDFVDTLLQVVALDDIVGLIVYSVAITVAVVSFGSGKVSAGSVLLPLAKNIGVLLLGAGFGVLMKLAIQHRRSSDNRLIIAIALLFSFCGICTAIDVSPLLGCMAMSTVYFNITDDDKLFKQLNYFSPPLLLLFFVRSGLSFDLGALLKPSGAIGSTPLLLIGALYFLVRIVGKYIGAYLGCLLAKKPVKTRTTLGLALIPQAGVAIGLAALGARTLGGAVGSALQTIILASSVLYELVGPVCAKLALYLSGSYSNRLEELVEVPETTEAGEKRTDLELLIERIQKIQAELSVPKPNEEEEAYTEAAMQQLGALPGVQARKEGRGR